MADYYLEFSEIVRGLSDAEAAWLANQLQSVAVIDGVQYVAEQVPSEAAAKPVTWEGPRFLCGVAAYEESPDEPAFGYEFGIDDTEDGAGRYLCLYSEEHGDLDQVALLVQKFLREFRPADVWTITYATTCSKPRVGAFGGGVGVVTADTIEWQDAELLADKARQQIARQQAATKLSPAS